MDEIIDLLKTLESCEQYARNVEQKQPERAQLARRKAVRLKAEQEGATNPANTASH